jgi:type II secretory pathway pseudopilin PulG
MLTVARGEYAALTLLAGTFITFLIPSLLDTRADIRDGLRKQDIAYLKRSLEQFYNEHNYYPPIRARLAPQGGPRASNTECITTRQPDTWPFIQELPHDVREDRGFDYRYCVTSGNASGATGYFLEARLEGTQPDQHTFDEDELRKFYFRILHSGGKTIYRVCGGEETQCEPE